MIFSWYSWIINSLVNGVYAFGFLFMMPQLFLNYKLKSVAHLPWRAFMYKVNQSITKDPYEKFSSGIQYIHRRSLCVYYHHAYSSSSRLFSR